MLLLLLSYCANESLCICSISVVPLSKGRSFFARSPVLPDKVKDGEEMTKEEKEEIENNPMFADITGKTPKKVRIATYGSK